MNFSSVHNVQIFGPAYLLYVCTHILVLCTRTCTPYLLILPYITCSLKSHPFRFSQFPQFSCTTIPNSYNHKPNPHHNYTYFQSSSSHTGFSYEPQPFICTVHCSCTVCHIPHLIKIYLVFCSAVIFIRSSTTILNFFLYQDVLKKLIILLIL